MSDLPPPKPRATITWGHRVQDLLIRGVERTMALLPEPLAVLLGGGLGRLAGSVFRFRRSVVEANLRRAFPDASPAWIRRTAAAAYAHLGREGVALLRMGELGPDEVLKRTDVEGIEHLEAPLSEGRGVILLTGHLGNWEIGGGALAVRGLPMDVVAKRQRNPLFNTRVNRTREGLGMRVVDRVQSTRTLLRSLRGGRVVALVADQNVITGGVFVEFFGTPAATARGPALLALRTGAAVAFATAIRQPGLRAHYRIRVHPLASPSEELEPDAATRDLLRRYLAVLEAGIREAPEQYLWAHKRWKTRPPDDDSVPAATGETPRPPEELPAPQDVPPSGEPPLSSDFPSDQGPVP